MNHKWLPAFIIVLLGCIWGSSFILIKRGLVSFEPIQVAALRLTLGSMVLLPVILYHIKKIKRIDAWNLFLSGFIGNGVPAFLFSSAGDLIPSSLSGIFNAFTPMFTLLVGFLMFRAKFTRSGILGVISGICGAIILLLPGILSAKQTQIHLGGSLMVLSAAVMYGYNINLIKSKLSHLSPLIVSAFPMFFMAIPYAFILYFTKVQNAWMEHPKEVWGSFGYLCILGILGSAISLIIFNALIKKTTALVASTNTFVIPVVAVMWGIADKENLSWNMILGLVFSLLGVYLVLQKTGDKPATTDEAIEFSESGQ